MQITYSPVSEKDIEECYVYISQDNQKSADQFLDSLQNLAKMLAKLPNIGQFIELESLSSVAVRYIPIPSFANHILFYTHEKTHLRVLRILHSARDFNVELLHLN